MVTNLRAIFLALLTTIVMSPEVSGQIEYRKPSESLVDIVDAPTTPTISLSPGRDMMLLQDVPSLPSIAELSQPELKLAGSRISPRTFGPSRTRYRTGMSLQRIADGALQKVTGLPDPAYLANVTWSPDGRHICFTCTVTENGQLSRIEPWVVEVSTAKARRLADVGLNLTAGVAPTWLPDSTGVVAVLVPSKLAPAPEPNPVPRGPTVQESSGKRAPARTYQDLLKSEFDSRQFEYYFTGQIAKIDLEGDVQAVSEPRIVGNVSVSPSGNHLLVETIHRPFSFRVPAGRFPTKIEIWDRGGRVVHTVADLPLREEVPMAFGSVPMGPRSVGWRADAEDTVVWAEALDGGDARVDAELRDRVLMLAAPFDRTPETLAKTELRYAGITWGDDRHALLTEFWWKTRRTRTWLIQPGNPQAAARKIIDRSYQDRYSDPGRPVTQPTSTGRRVLALQRGTDGSAAVYMIGAGASPEGDRPFLDQMDLASGKTKRMFQSKDPHYELPVTVFAEGDTTRLIFRRESVVDPPNYYLAELANGATAKEQALTQFKHPTPQLRDLKKELIRYKRSDGVDLSATLYLPPGYKASDGPLPMIMWAYPTEFKSKKDAGQIQGSPYRFDRITHWSPMIFLAEGYAVLDDPQMPIIGEGNAEPNDEFVEQLVASAKAAVDEMVKRKVTEPGRIAIGGHSYGAFMTANLLAHSDLFAAGIARSGAYNRTLTPFGFQAEERSLWEAPEIYFQMSPFMHAEKVNEPILLIHGQMDNNSGTFPMQSERYFSALKGHGATARLVMLPYESHGYRSRESLLHMLWEQEQWLDRYVRNGKTRSTSKDSK